MLKDLTYLTDRLKELEETYANEVRKEINTIFSTYPEVAGIIVQHWTPFFNDGEECRYGTHGVFAYPHDLFNRLSEEDKENMGVESQEELEQALLSNAYLLDEIDTNFSPSFDEVEQWITKFWDHKMLIITNGEQGITKITKNEWVTEYYEHD